MSIKSYEEKFRAQIIAVWEKSVRATHEFVRPDDIEYFKQIVEGIDFRSLAVHCLIDKDEIIGFVGVADETIEMLFLDPDFIGHGLGKRLMIFALERLNANRVDVNEQNFNAVNFYTKFGFVTYARKEKDQEGKDYPILRMKLQKE